jgi:hypothetical protein
MYLRMTFWTPAVAYAGFSLAGGESMPNKMGMLLTTGFMGALLGFLLAIVFTPQGTPPWEPSGPPPSAWASPA